MSRKPEVQPIDVRYNDGEPRHITATTVRWEGDNRHTVEHKFRMEGSTATLVTFKPDTPTYNWPANEDARKAAADAVDELPFVQAVAMPGGEA